MSLRNPNVYRVLLIAVNSCLIVYIVRIGERGGEGGRERDRQVATDVMCTRFIRLLEGKCNLRLN